MYSTHFQVQDDFIRTAEIVGNSTLASAIVPKFVVLQNTPHIAEPAQDARVVTPLQTDDLIVTITPEVKLVPEEFENLGKEFEDGSPLNKQKLTQALRYALSIIASYELQVRQNVADLPPGYCQGHVFKFARNDILKMAGITEDGDLYENDDVSI